MKRFNRLSAIWASFYSRDLYRDVATRWTGVGLLYLWLVLSLSWLPSAARWCLGLRDFAAVNVPAIAKQIPTVTIANGVMSASPSGRHVLRAPPDVKHPDGEVVLIIDDTVDTVPPESDSDMAILTRKEFGTVRPSRNERRVWALTPAADMVVTPEKVSGFLSGLQYWVPIVGYGGAVAGSLVSRAVQAMLYAAGVLMYARRHGASFGHATAGRLAVVAVTPVIVIRTLLWTAGWDPAWYVRWPAALLITIFYLRFAVRAAAAPATSETVYSS